MISLVSQFLSAETGLAWALRAAWVPFATSRLFAFAVSWLANSAVPYGRPQDPIYPAPWRGLLSWDAVHYLRIARQGYPTFSPSQENGFFPLLPLVLRGTGANEAAALALCLVFGLAGITLMTALTAGLVGDEVAVRSAWLASWWPLGLYWSAVYTEGLFLALAAGALWAATRQRPVAAAALALLAGLLRPAGAGLVLPLALTLIGWSRLLAVAPVIGTAAFAVWIGIHTGDPLALLHGQAAGRPRMHPGDPLGALAGPASTDLRTLWAYAVGLSFLAILAVALWLLRGVVGRDAAHARGVGYATVAGLLAPVAAAGTLESLGRYLMVAFPIYWGLQRLPAWTLWAVGAPALVAVTATAGTGWLTP